MLKADTILILIVLIGLVLLVSLSILFHDLDVIFKHDNENFCNENGFTNFNEKSNYGSTNTYLCINNVTGEWNEFIFIDAHIDAQRLILVDKESSKWN